MTRTGWLKVANSIYWLLLALWFGGLAMAAISAAAIFPTMKQLDVIVPEYRAFAELEGEHWLIAAGRAQNTVFWANDLIQLLCSVGVAVILGLHLTIFRMKITRPANILRTLAIALGLSGVCYELFVLAPRMQSNLQEFWSLPETGDIEAALAARDAFQADHPTATTTLVFTFICVGVAVMTSAAALTTPESAGDARGKDDGGLEEPELLRRPR